MKVEESGEYRRKKEIKAHATNQISKVTDKCESSWWRNFDICETGSKAKERDTMVEESMVNYIGKAKSNEEIVEETRDRESNVDQTNRLNVNPGYLKSDNGEKVKEKSQEVACDSEASEEEEELWD